MAQLCGPGGDAEFGLHHWLVLAERHHTSARYPDGQVWAPPDPPGGQVMLVKNSYSRKGMFTYAELMC